VRERRIHPAAEELTASEDVYVNLIRMLYEAKEEEFTEAKAREEYRRMASPTYTRESADLVTTQGVIDELSLSQSSASRHLTQLAATGLMAVDASERTKKYSVRPKRVADVCESIRHLLTEQTPTG
jgi:DNA-binding transcriptional ArsR family regulator